MQPFLRETPSCEQLHCTVCIPEEILILSFNVNDLVQQNRRFCDHIHPIVRYLFFLTFLFSSLILNLVESSRYFNSVNIVSQWKWETNGLQTDRLTFDGKHEGEDNKRNSCQTDPLALDESQPREKMETKLSSKGSVQPSDCFSWKTRGRTWKAN